MRAVSKNSKRPWPARLDTVSTNNPAKPFRFAAGGVALRRPRRQLHLGPFHPFRYSPSPQPEETLSALSTAADSKEGSHDADRTDAVADRGNVGAAVLAGQRAAS